MVNEKKVQLMTQITLEEEGKDGDIIREGGYFRGDFIRARMTYTMWNLTIGYILFLVLIALYHLDYILISVTEISYLRIGLILGGIYVLLMLICALASYVYHSTEYVHNKQILEKYQDKLESLQTFYREDKEDADSDSVTDI